MKSTGSDGLPGRGLTKQVRALALRLKPHLSSLDSKFAQCLRQERLDPAKRRALSRITSLAAARMLLKRKTLKDFLEMVEDVGRDLARLNVLPAEVARVLQSCDELIAEVNLYPESAWVTEQLGFCTILALNQAYYDIREAESRAFYELFLIEVESSNLDILFRRFIETMPEACGAAAAHLFFLTEDQRQWRLQASTAEAATRKTLAVQPATAATRRVLSIPRPVHRPQWILDQGWVKSYRSIWSIPLPGAGVMQLAFRQQRELFPREIEMLVAAGERCYAAAKKTRLLEDIAEREEKLSKLAIRMLRVEENERRRISRELHDDAGQSLVVIRLQMEMIEQALPPGSEERERLAEARDIAEKTILDLRRLIGDLSPAVLEQLGLGAALRQLVNRFRGRFPGDVRLDVAELPPLDTHFQSVIYRLAQECLNNISQHSQAAAVNISISAADRVLKLIVGDNGIGFQVDEALSRKDCFGLTGIRERVAVLGGTVSISSTCNLVRKTGRRKKSGTVVAIDLPIR